MLYLPSDEMFVNKFVYVELPTKAQIFSRTGQKAVSPNGEFTKDEPAVFGKSNTQSMAEFAAAAEAYKEPSEIKENE